MQITFADITDAIEWGTEEVPDLDVYGCIPINDDGLDSKLKSLFIALLTTN